MHEMCGDKMPRLFKLRGISSRFESAVPGKLSFRRFKTAGKLPATLGWHLYVSHGGKEKLPLFLAERSYPNGPRPLRGSVERSFGREIERDPPRGRGRPNRVCPKS